MDMWFLMDFEKGLWVKQLTVEVNLSAHPLVILKNGSIVIVIYIGSRGSLRFIIQGPTLIHMWQRWCLVMELLCTRETF